MSIVDSVLHTLSVCLSVSPCVQVFSAEHCSFTFSGYNHLASVLDMYEESPLIRSDLMTVWDVLKHRPLCQKVSSARNDFSLFPSHAKKGGLA